MKRTVLSILSVLLSAGISMNGAREGEDIPGSAISESSDSLNPTVMSVAQEAMPMSEVQEGLSFLRGVIPPPPQAAAITRYAEYPVSHTTGIPDISIPLYEIDLGGYTLPISISYHASGCRPGDMPGYVGSGWTLNAGGAITRTILGAPDRPMTDTELQLPCYDDRFIRDQIDDVQKTGGGPGIGYIASIVGLYDDHDTESDRYAFNVAGHSGVFRYDHTNCEYVFLNNCNWIMESYNEGPRFRIATNDQIVYEFNEQERSGADSRDTEPPHVTAWYVTRIETPYGNITFRYGSGSCLYVQHSDVTATYGTRLEIEEGSNLTSDADFYFFWRDRYETEVSRTYYTYQQRPLESIEWSGGKVTFEYVEEYRGKTLKRLTSMKVNDPSGNLRKTVEFDNTDNWPTNDSSTGRRLLRSVSDSEHGIWCFEYDKTITATPWSVIPTPNCLAQYTDFWGYLNTSEPSNEKDVFTERQVDWLLKNAHSPMKRPATRDRKPSLQHTKAGILTSVTFPTGGRVTYEYELNRFCNMDVGGLRVKSYIVQDGPGSPMRTISFDYVLSYRTTEEPEDLMHFYSYRYMTENPAYSFEGRPQIGGTPVGLRTCVTFPITPVSGTSCPVVYTYVIEKRPDGSSVAYMYDGNELSQLYGVGTEYEHPCTYYQSVNDWGIREPLLLSRTVSDADGKEMERETYTYLKRTCRTFSAGVRTVCPYYEHMVPYNQWQPITVTPELVVRFGMLQHKPSTAHVRANLLLSRTATDLRTGFMTKTEYTYDDSLRTMKPKTVTVTGSDGTDIRTEYSYFFDLDDETSRKMAEDYFIVDTPLETRVYAGETLLAADRTEMGFFNMYCLPAALHSWSQPTGKPLSGSTVPFSERERIMSRNGVCRPLTVKTEDTDLHIFGWNTEGNLLLSSTSPGGLTTTYAHRPLFGLSSSVMPNGNTNLYSYDDTGMLSGVSDSGGVLSKYARTLSSHPDPSIQGIYNSVITDRSLDPSGTRTVRSVQYYDGLGRPSTTVEGGLNTAGRYVYSSVSYDNLGRQFRTTLPAIGGKDPSYKDFTQVKELSASTYANDNYAWSETSYDTTDRPIKVSTPGEAWHSAGKGKTTEYISNAPNSVRLYRAPMDCISLVEDGHYAAKTLQGVRTIDEDGNEMTVYTDRLGRKVLERRGPEGEKGSNDTYFVYNALGQLRYVLTPGYELSGYKDEFAYEYRYDERGDMVKKFIPGGGCTQYWYDRARRLSFMQDPNLRENGLHRFFLYDREGRMVIQGVSGMCTRGPTVNFADYVGDSGGFMSTRYALEDASRLQQVTLEVVNYYDGYSFVQAIDGRLGKSGTAPATGLQTGSVTYSTDGLRSVRAMYHDIRGNVTDIIESTPFGTLRKTANTYNYSGQPLRTVVSEGGVTVVTENTYDVSSGLLTATDVTVNGVKQRVAKTVYNGLGRISSIARAVEKPGEGKVEYTYNIHGQTTEITGPGFSQSLYYADGPGKKLYNGSVSAMTWTMGTDTRIRGYRYSYNAYGWLTLAEYGENTTLKSNPNRYTERLLEFMPNGGVRRLQRHGLKADGVYGKVDNLHITYEGNRIKTVLDDALPVTQPGSMDFPVSGREMSLRYNEWGGLISDGSRGIADISYDCSGNPLRISYSDGAYTEYVYSAIGEKLRMTHSSVLDASATDTHLYGVLGSTGDIDGRLTATSVTEYHGDVIYRDGKVWMVLFPGGYATLEGGVTFHYYTQDYLGNIRAVTNGTSGEIEQTVAYYPFGGVIADLGSPHGGQPFWFGGKELVTANGLNEYDFGARQYWQAVPHFTRIDPLCEVSYHLSPYLFCGNDPVNKIDPSGKVVIGLDEQAQRNILYSLSEDEAKFVKFNDDGVIDAELLNQSSSYSDNFVALKSVVNSETLFYVSTSSQYTSAGQTKNLKEQGEGGTVGVTLMPNAQEEPSPDSNVHIFTSNKISISEQVENLAHELYGHGYFYELHTQGNDVSPFHDYRAVVVEGDFLPEYNIHECVSIRVDLNTRLNNQIKKVTKMGKTNYNSRLR